MHPLKYQREGVKYGRGVKYGVTLVFAKKLRPILGLNKGLILRLVCRRLKQVLNMEHALTNAHFKVHLCTVCIDFLKKSHM